MTIERAIAIIGIITRAESRVGQINVDELRESLFLAIDALERKSGWIQISGDSLPDSGKVGLLKFSNAHFPAVGYYSKTYDCFTTISGGQYPKSLVTHFHDLPELTVD